MASNFYCMYKLMVLVLLQFSHQQANGQNEGCTCADVKTVPVTLDEFEDATPLFSEVASTATEQLAIDNVCYTSAPAEYGDGIDLAMSITYQNGTDVGTFLRQRTIEPGSFQLTGDSTFKDFILGVPCDDTFVIYRCFANSNPCPSDVSQTIVIIESSLEQVPQKCIKKGIRIARKTFPGIEFYSLPRELNTNCLAI